MMKSRITSGEGNVAQLRRIALHQRRAVVAAAGDRNAGALRFAREYKGRPYLAHEGAPDFNRHEEDPLVGS